MLTPPERPGMQFITYDNKQNGRSHDSKTRRLVRKQARIASQHQQKSPLILDPKTGSCPVKASSLKQYQGRFRLAKSLQIPNEITAQSPIALYISPLGPTIRSLDHDASILLSYYYHVFQRGCVAIDFEEDWLGFILSNNATCHALLTLVALKYEGETSADSPPWSIQHSAAAVRHLRKEVDAGPEMPDDSLICAVALLTVTESIRDDEASSAMHFGGLSQMLRLRGGRDDTFSNNKTLQKIISWARRIHCLQSNQPLDLPPVPPSSVLASDCLDEEAQRRSAFQALSTKRNSYTHVISRELEDILDSLHVLSTFPPNESRTSAHRRTISCIIYDTEYRLIQLNQSHLVGLSNLSSNRKTLSNSYQLAVQIYVLMALRRLQPGSGLVQRYVKVLRSDTQHRQLPTGDISASAIRTWVVLLVWIESVLAIATNKMDHEEETVLDLRVLLECIGCISFEQYMMLLKEVCWLDGLDGYLEDIIADVWSKTRRDSVSYSSSTDA